MADVIDSMARTIGTQVPLSTKPTKDGQGVPATGRKHQTVNQARKRITKRFAELVEQAKAGSCGGGEDAFRWR